MGSEKKKVVMLPWLAHGHITPFLELAKGLSEKNFICYVCSTPVNLSSIRNRIPANYSSRIHLLPLQLPASPDLPPHYHTTNGLPLHLHAALRKALTAAKPDFLNLVGPLHPDLLIHDFIMTWAAEAAAANLNIPSVAFSTAGAAPISYFCHFGRHPGVEFPFADTLLSISEFSKVYGGAAFDPHEREEKDDDEAFQRCSAGLLVNSSREMEGRYLDYSSQLLQKKVVSIGALVQQDSCGEGDGDAEIMEWLAGKDEGSSVLVSFGSEYFLKREEIEAVANGLEQSNVNFIWIVRFPKGEEVMIEEALPQGFLERVGERGKIVEKWAPQAKILGHGSIGGFVSHCGWNSLKESICFEVPIIAMPMHLDQPINAKLAVELGVGVEVKRDDDGRFVEGEISSVIKDVVAGETGEILRRRVRELSERIRNASGEEMDGVAQFLAHLCGKNIVQLLGTLTANDPNPLRIL